MTDDEELREMDVNAAEARLKDYRDGLDALRRNPQIMNYAAEEYIDEAISHLEAAIADVERAREE